MKLEDQVVSLGLARKLKKLGVKQESLWYWWKSKIGKFYLTLEHAIPQGYNSYSAFTTSELGKLLPASLLINNLECSLKLWCNDSGDYWYCGYGINGVLEINGSRANADTEANARAKMLIYLLEQELKTNQS